MNFIKKIFDGQSDGFVHLQFQKFSKGEFTNRAIIEAKKTGKGYTLKTSAEFANELVRTIAEKLGSDKARITGAVVSTSDLAGELEFKEKKQFQGVKRYLIDKEMAGDELVNLLNKFPKTFFALSFEVGDTKLKIKPKAPKSGKPGKGDEAPKADFCNLKTSDEEIAKEFVFDTLKDTSIPDFKEVKINHTFFIERIEIPEELKNSKDFSKIREESKRGGRIARNATIDGQEIKSEIGFSA